MATAQRRQREKEERRRQILDTAEKVFFEKGFDQATVDEIAARAEISKGLVYVYFQNKQELYRALTLRGLELLHAQMQEASEGDEPARWRFREAGRAYIEFSQLHPGYYQAVSDFGSAEMSRSEPGTYEEACTQELLAILDMITELLEEGQKDGSVRSDLPSRQTAITVWSLTHGLIQMAALRGDFMCDCYDIECSGLHNVFFELMGTALAGREGSEPLAPADAERESETER